jgi:hypothetical protein
MQENQYFAALASRIRSSADHKAFIFINTFANYEKLQEG